jgi:hypothetical protein
LATTLFDWPIPERILLRADVLTARFHISPFSLQLLQPRSSNCQACSCADLPL